METPTVRSSHVAALYDFCAPDLSPVALRGEETRTLRAGASSSTTSPPLSLFFFAVTSVSREDERIRVRAASAAGRPPCLITTSGSPRVFVPPFFFSSCFPSEHHLGENASARFRDFARSPLRCG